MHTQPFLDFWRELTTAERQGLARRANTSQVYLSQIAHGHRNAGASLLARLKRADNRITDFMLRPDLYGPGV